MSGNPYPLTVAQLIMALAPLAREYPEARVGLWDERIEVHDFATDRHIAYVYYDGETTSYVDQWGGGISRDNVDRIVEIAAHLT